ncbi:MAG: hypothetical protein LBR32_10720 [Propionibacteriaceae bacterium]|jgi:hypothetical protein|nr:hypothetical protein [Propionibacteriaceae bacterium]
MNRWHVPDCYIPPRSSGGQPSHESICVLNDSSQDAHLTLTAYFADREPERSAPVLVPARRDLHLRTAIPEQVGGLRLQPDVPYGIVVESEADLKVQYSRLDTTQPAYTLMTALLPSHN